MLNLMATDRDLQQMAALLRSRNEIDKQIGQLLGRPMTSGHLGEWIASNVFDIDLEDSAVATAIDGRFRGGPLNGRSVNVKWYLKRESLLDMTAAPILDYYLVFTGPRATVASSRGTLRPWVIDSVYLFDADELLRVQRDRGVKIGIASSVPTALWDRAEIYPRATNATYVVDGGQADRLRLFATT